MEEADKSRLAIGEKKLSVADRLRAVVGRGGLRKRDPERKWINRRTSPKQTFPSVDHSLSERLLRTALRASMTS